MFGSLLSGALSWFGGEQQNRRQADAAEQAQGFSASQFASRYQTTVADMQKAGLNPMLAYSQGGGSPPSGVQANVPVNSGAAAASGFQAQRLNNAQVDLIEAQKDATSAQAAKTKAETPYVGPSAEADIGAKSASADQSRAMVSSINATVDKTRQEIENMPKGVLNGMTASQWNMQLLRRTADNLQEQASLAREKGYTEEQVREQMKATIGKLVSETKLNQLDIDSAEKFENFGREYKQYAPIIELLKSILTLNRRQ